MILNPEIMAGEGLAKLIKEAYHAEEIWSPKLAIVVGAKMSQLKKIVRPMFPDLTVIQLLEIVGAWSAQDIRDSFDDFSATAKEGLCSNGSQAKSIGALMGSYTENKLS